MFQFTYIQTVSEISEVLSIVKFTELTIEEVQAIARGEDIDKEDDE